MKYGLSNRQVILVACNWNTRNNVGESLNYIFFGEYIPPENFLPRSLCIIKYSRYELHSLQDVQNASVHYSQLKCIKFEGISIPTASADKPNTDEPNTNKKPERIYFDDPATAKFIDEVFFSYEPEDKVPSTTHDSNLGSSNGTSKEKEAAPEEIDLEKLLHQRIYFDDPIAAKILDNLFFG